MFWGATAVKMWSGMARSVLSRLRPYADDLPVTRG
jgi:hypothetical protein